MKLKRILLAALLAISSPAGAQVNAISPDVITTFSAGYKNYVKNPSALKNALDFVAPAASVTRGTTNKIDNVASWTVDATAVTDYAQFTLKTINAEHQTGNCEFEGKFLGDGTLYRAEILDGSANLLAYTPAFTNETSWKSFSVTYPCGSSRRVRITQSVAGTAPAISVGELYYGPATGIGTVSQAEMAGTGYWPATSSCAWAGATGTSYVDFTADTDCPNPTVTQGATAAGTKVPQININNAKEGNYAISANVHFYINDVSSICWYALTDESNNILAETYISAAEASFNTASIVGSQSVAAGASKSYKLRSRRQSGTGTCGIWNDTATKQGNTNIIVMRFPSQSEQAISSISQKAPTITKITSGSGTYTVPSGVVLLRVRGVGGGAGGSGSATSGWAAAGGSGGNTTFGSSLLTATGGLGGQGFENPNGGTATINSPAVEVLKINGGYGSPGQSKVSNSDVPGGTGAGSVFGGSGGSPLGGFPGNPGKTNSGAGGGGGTLAFATSGSCGAGGGAGAYFEAIIVNPSSSYSYAVGAAGTGGTAGSGGQAGGAGGSGYIAIEEYYSYGQVPILLGSVTYSDIVAGAGVAGANTVAHGSYTPVFTSLSNVDSITVTYCSFLRVATIVQVACQLSIDATAGSTYTQFFISLPVAATFTADGQAAGSGIKVDSSLTSTPAILIRGFNAGTTVRAGFFSDGSAARVFSVNFQYQIP